MPLSSVQTAARKKICHSPPWRPEALALLQSGDTGRRTCLIPNFHDLKDIPPPAHLRFSLSWPCHRCKKKPTPPPDDVCPILFVGSSSFIVALGQSIHGKAVKRLVDNSPMKHWQKQRSGTDRGSVPSPSDLLTKSIRTQLQQLSDNELLMTLTLGK